MKKYFFSLFGKQHEIQNKLLAYIEHTEAMALDIETAVGAYLCLDEPEFSKMPQAFVSTDHIRSLFTEAMSQMYRTEVPQYGALIELVGEVNAEVLAKDQELSERLRHAGA